MWFALEYEINLPCAYKTGLSIRPKVRDANPPTGFDPDTLQCNWLLALQRDLLTGDKLFAP